MLNGGFRGGRSLATSWGVDELVAGLLSGDVPDDPEHVDHFGFTTAVWYEAVDGDVSGTVDSIDSYLVVAVNGRTGYGALVYDHELVTVAGSMVDDPQVPWDSHRGDFVHPRHVVSLDEVVAGVREFCGNHGELPSAVRWAKFHVRPEHPSASVLTWDDYYRRSPYLQQLPRK